MEDLSAPATKEFVLGIVVSRLPPGLQPRNPAREYYRGMAELHMTENEAARDFHAVVERVSEGLEIVIERDHRPVAVIRTPPGVGRSIDEAIAIAQAFEAKLGYSPVPDPDFAKDVQEGIDAHREPLNPPDWD
jgi:antitoxin (DNA-binding transcriptional repressor) of toxin-antitoxin stability system